MKKTNKKRNPLKILLRVICVFIMIITLLIAMFLVIFLIKYGPKINEYSHFAAKVVRESSPNTFNTQNTGNIYYSNGKLIANLRQAKDTRYITINEMPKNAINAFIAVEDRRFYKHDGVDYKGIMRVLYEYIKSKGHTLHGASTITQQLARNIFLSHEVSFERKIKEAFIAKDLEKKYTKNDILEFYLNNIYFGHNYYGIGSAAKGYFNKNISELNLAQIAFLAAIPNNPTLFDPVTNYDNTQKRKLKILNDMLEDKYITQEEYDKAVEEKIKVKKPKSSIHDYETTYAIECASRALLHQEGFNFKYSYDSMDDYKQYTEEYNEAMEQVRHRLYTQGYNIMTSIDQDRQNEFQKIVDNRLSFNNTKSDNKIFKLQGALTCIDNKTHKVIAIIGGRKQKKISGYTLNRAYQGYRQPGSTIKPLIVYTPILQNPKYNANTILDDKKIKGGPRNAGDAYMGKISLMQAVEKSKNIPAWTLFKELGERNGLKYIQEMDFRKIVPDDYYPPAALGGLSLGCTTEEMAGGYETLVNGGIFNEPTCIQSITNIRTGQEFYEPTPSKQVYDKDATIEMVQILRGVLTRGTAAYVGWNNKNIQAAGKTGTTNETKDAWFCGITPYYTMSVWMGYDSPQGMYDAWGRIPIQIWKEAITSLMEGLPPAKFSELELKSNTTEEISNKDDNINNKISDLLNKLYNLDPNSYDEAMKIYNNAKALNNTLKDEELKKENAAELDSVIKGFKKSPSVVKPDINNENTTENNNSNENSTDTSEGNNTDNSVELNTNNDNSSEESFDDNDLSEEDDMQNNKKKNSDEDTVTLEPINNNHN